MTDALGDRLQAYRAQREELERSILPLATSLDGREFGFQASLHELDLQAGGSALSLGSVGRRGALGRAPTGR